MLTSAPSEGLAMSNDGSISLEERLEDMNERLQATHQVAMGTAQLLDREIYKVDERRKYLDGRIEQIFESIYELRQTTDATAKRIESALMFARVGRLMITTAAAVGATTLGVLGWWAEIKAYAKDLLK